MHIFDSIPKFKVNFASFDCSKPRDEFEIKQKIVEELRELRSDKPGRINSISIDRAIDIVLKA